MARFEEYRESYVLAEVNTMTDGNFANHCSKLRTVLKRMIATMKCLFNGVI